jgi:hypothetical protein
VTIGHASGICRIEVQRGVLTMWLKGGKGASCHIYTELASEYCKYQRLYVMRATVPHATTGLGTFDPSKSLPGIGYPVSHSPPFFLP